MDERRPPGRGVGRLGNPRNPFSFRGNALLVGGDYTELKEPEIRPALPPLKGPQRRAQPASAAQRTPFSAAAALPIAQTRRVLPAPLGRCC